MGKKNNSKIISRIFLAVFICSFVFQQIPMNAQLKSSENIQKNLETSIPNSTDVAGNDMYSETINAKIAGKYSLITQSYITNDTNILKRMDLQDPAFIGGSFFMSVSNGIQPKMYPSPVTAEGSQNSGISYTANYGFLFYDNSSSAAMIEIRKNRAASILKETFDIDLIMLAPIENRSFGYIYPFVGWYPNWESYLYTVTENVPKDGYWSAFDKDRLLDLEYNTKNHLSSTLLFTKNYDHLTYGLSKITSEQLGFSFDLSNYGLSSNTMLSSLESIGGLSGLTGLLGGTTGQDNSTGDLGSLTGILGDMSAQMTNTVQLNIVFEGISEAIVQTSESTYEFDFFKAINYEGEKLAATQKSFNSIIGSLLSGISISFYSAEVMESYPAHIAIDDYNLNRIEMILFILNMNIDLSAIAQYSFRFGWQSDNFMSNLILVPENTASSTDIMNFLGVMDLIGFPMIPGALTEPLTELKFTYRILSHEPFLNIKKTVQNASRVVFSDPVITTFVENQQLYDVYGVPLNLSVLGITNNPETNMITQTMGLTLEDEGLRQALEAKGYKWDELFPNVNGRFFLIDSSGSGIPDIIYPNILDIGTVQDIYRFGPYGVQFANALYADPAYYADYFGGDEAIVNFVAGLFYNPQSIFNPANWVLNPGQNLTFTSVTDTTGLDTFTPFYNCSVSEIPDVSPILSYGQQVLGSSINATFQNDNNTWNVTSQNFDDISLIQEYLTFKNTTDINFGLNTTDGLRFLMNFTSIPIDNLEIELFNYTGAVGQEFVSIYSGTPTNGVVDITIRDVNYDLTDLYDQSKNYSFLMRITVEDGSAFELKTEIMRIQFLDRNQNIYTINPAVVYYSTEIGRNQYTSTSNGLILGTEDCSSLSVLASIDQSISYSGELKSYNLSISNRGNKAASNITVRFAQPGVIHGLSNPIEISDLKGNRTIMSAGNFTIDRGILTMNITNIQPGETLSNITFWFYTPNSRIIEAPRVSWEDYRDRSMNRTDYSVRGNSLYISAPVIYNSTKTTPFIHQLTLQYLSDFTQKAPQINETFSVDLSLHSENALNAIYDFSMLFPCNTTGLRLLNDTTKLRISSINLNETLVFHYNFEKTNYRGYLLSTPNYFNTLEPLFIQILPKSPLMIGKFDLSLHKTLDTYDDVIGTIFNVSITMKNNGNIELGNLTLNDIFCYDALGFNLKSGFMVKDISLLRPGESVTLTYQLIIVSKGYYNMTAAEVSYFFGWHQMTLSEEYRFKAREQYWVLTARLYLPLLLAISGVLLTKHLKLKYDREELDLSRRETLLFGASLKDTSWYKKNVMEFFDEELKNEKRIPKVAAQNDLDRRKEG